MSQQWEGWRTVHAEVIFCSWWNYTKKQEVVAFHFDFYQRIEKFSRQIKTKSTCIYAQGKSTVGAFIQTLRCDRWLDSCLACFMPFKQSHIYVLHLGGPGWIIIMLPFSPHYNSGLDCAWHWALAWLRHGLNESKYKIQTKAISNVWSSRLWQIQANSCAIPDKKILANQVQKIRFNAVCWGNHHYCVTCGCHFNAVSYFVLWYFLICPTSSRRCLD